MAVIIQKLIRYSILLFLLLASTSWAGEKLVFEGDSPYTGIQVYDKDDGLRYMKFDVYEQTAMNLSDPTYIHYGYQRSAMAAFAFIEKPVNNILLVGLGGGTVAKFITAKFPNATLDIYELDPLVVELAQRYFNFKLEEHGRVKVGDGRQLLRKSAQKFDLIILDACKVGGIPFHLTTFEFMQSVKEHLADDGVVVVHLWAEYANKYLKAQIKTIAEVFLRSYSFFGEGSYTIFATQHMKWLEKDTVVERGKNIGIQKAFGFDLGKLIFEKYTDATRISNENIEGQILTDDFAPVNLLKYQPDR